MPTESDRPKYPGQRASFVALLAILALAFAIRLVGIDWDDGRYLHPDERHIVADVLVGRIDLSWPPTSSWVDPEESPLNPRPRNENGSFEGFAYGTFPVYVVDAIGGVAEKLTGADWNGYERAGYIGRALSILLDTGTVLLAYLIGVWLFGRYAGLVAAALYAFLPVAIQASHFFTVDSWMTFFIFAALYTAIRAADRGSVWLFPLAATWFGLALASKTTAAPVAGILVLAIALATTTDVTRGMSIDTVTRRAGIRAISSVVAFLMVYSLGEPFAFLQPEALLDSFRQQADIQSGAWDVPFTQQYVGTPRGSYHLEQAVRYHMGPVPTQLGLAGAAGLVWFAVKQRSRGALLLAAWIVGFAIVILWPETKFPRYTLPIAPALAITAGFAITSVAAWIRLHGRRTIAVGFVVATVTLSAGFGTAFASVTSTEHTRISASVWMYENLPPGSRTTNEIWDDRLPLSIEPGHSSDSRRIDGASINLYSTTPTFGDIAQLAPAVALIPGGESAAAMLQAGRVDEAVDELRRIGPIALRAPVGSSALVREASLLSEVAQAPNAAAFVPVDQLEAELRAAAFSMTTSSGLAQAVQQIADDVVASDYLEASNVSTLADAIESARNESLLHQTYTLLSDADYYVLASDRVKRGMVQNPWRHAVPIRMYQLLDSGDAGYTPVAEFRSVPSLFGMQFPDADADETFINYDHPVVQIYSRDELVPFDRYVELMGAAPLQQNDPSRSPDTEPLTFGTPVSELPEVFDARWSEALTGSSWGATIVWIVMLVLLQAAAWPLARAVFRSFPDAGWGLARAIGLIVPATTIWILASAELVQFRAHWVVVTVMLFALASWLWFRRERVRPDVRLIGAAEAVFWITFAIFLLFKLYNPDSWHFWWGGEKPMEYAQINAILRSPSFPPVDPWYAQGFINYYYYSFYLVAFLIKLTGIPTELAFNLAQPTVMALLASGAFSAGAMLSSRISRGRHSGLLGGVLSVLLVTFAGNMRSVALLLEHIRGEAVPLDPFMYWVWTPSRTYSDNGAQLITEFPYFSGLYGDLHSHVVGMVLLVLIVSLALSFVFDPVTGRWAQTRASLARLTIVAIAVGVIYPTNAWDLPVAAALVAASLLVSSANCSRVRDRVITVTTSLGAVSIGALLVSLPFLLHFEALFGSIERARSTTSLLELESHFGGLLLVATFAVPAAMSLLSGRALVPPLAGAATLTVVLLARWLAADRWPELVDWLDIATVVAVGAIWIGALPLRRSSSRRLDFSLPGIVVPIVAVATAIATIALIASGYQVAALWIVLGGSATIAFLVKRAPAVRVLGLLTAGASFIGAGVEFVYVADNLAGSDWARMNTVFKFYNQVWILLAIAGAAAASVMIMSLIDRLSPSGAQPTSLVRRLDWPVVATIATGTVLVLSTVFPATATGPRLETRFEPRDVGLTLDAYAWMDFGTLTATDGSTISFEEDRDVIDWFNSEIDGTPVIAEASIGTYRCNGSRISNGTGLPSVLGWEHHQTQQRYGDVLPQRNVDLRQLYASTNADTKLAILNNYDVRYVVVGNLERIYPVITGNDCMPMQNEPQYAETDLDAGIATFESMVGQTLEVAFQSGDTVVYRVVGNS